MEAIGRLTAGIAHDFSNTLTTLRLRIDRLSERDLDEDSRVDVDGVARTIARTQSLIADLSSFGSRQLLHPIVLSVNSEIERVASVLDGLLGDAIEIVLDLTADDTTVIVDPTRFEQIFTNLAINANDAMPAGGTLSIDTRIDTIEPHALATVRVPTRLGAGGYVVMTVTDTGVGIEPGDLAHVFDPYFTTKPPGRGTGLGLATTYGTITQSGGAVIVDSELGHGTAFSVWLPHQQPT